MSVEQIESQVLALPETERRQFLHWLDAHRHVILPEEAYVSDEIRQEIFRRSAELRGSPDRAEPVDLNYFVRMKRRVADALTQKAPTV